MPSPPSRSGILLFHRTPPNFSVSAGIPAAAARNGGPARPVGARASASPCTDASTVARWRIVATVVRGAVLVVTLVAMTNVAAMAQTVPSVAPLQYQGISDRIAAAVAEASRRVAACRGAWRAARRGASRRLAARQGICRGGKYRCV